MSCNSDKYKLSPLIRQNKKIIYNGEKYDIDFQLIVQNSNYFYQHRFKYEGKELIELEPEGSSITNESICTFIKTIQNEEFLINDKNIFSLHQLSIKYEVPKLTEITNEYISKHDIDLIFDIIEYKLSLFQAKEKEEEDYINNFDTEEEEEKIATDFFKYINRKELIELPVPVLYRIINNPQMKIENKSEQEKKEFIEFLFKSLNKHGREGSVLFSQFNMKENQEEVMRRLIEEYSSIFDFQMINPKFLIETLQTVLKEKERIITEHLILAKKIEEISNKLEEERKINKGMEKEINRFINNEIKFKDLNEQLSKENGELIKLNE